MNTIKEELKSLGIKHAYIADKFGLSSSEITTILKYETTLDEIKIFVKQINGIK